MIQTAEKIIESVRALPEVERKKFFELIEFEKISGKESQIDWQKKNEKFRLALKWIEENKAEYDGKFVVLDGNELVACGENAKAVYDEARVKGQTSPFLKKVRNKEDLPFGGW